MSEARAKSAVVGTASAPQVKVASSDPLYEALTQQIAYWISAVTNQNSGTNNGHKGSKSNNGNGKYLSTMFQKPKRDRKDMKCWGVGVHTIVGESVPHPGKVITFLTSPQIKAKIRIMVKI